MHNNDINQNMNVINRLYNVNSLTTKQTHHIMLDPVLVKINKFLYVKKISHDFYINYYMIIKYYDQIIIKL